MGQQVVLEASILLVLCQFQGESVNSEFLQLMINTFRSDPAVKTPWMENFFHLGLLGGVALTPLMFTEPGRRTSCF